MEWIKDNIWEIKKSSGLRYLGFFISLTHIITFLQWNALYSQPESGTNVVCWNFFPRCAEAAFVTGHGGALYTYLALGVLSGLLFLMGSALIGGAWTLLATTSALHLSMYLFDYRLYSNLQILLFFLEIGYLFVPNKKSLVKCLVIGYYLCSGLGKLNTEWLTGFKFESLGVPTKLNEWIAALSVMVELSIPFLLLSKTIKKVILGIALLISYHIMTGFIYESYTAAYLFLIFMFFPLIHWESQAQTNNYVYNSYIRPEPSKIWTPIAIGVFLFLQLLPIWIPSEWPTTPFQLSQARLPVECEQKSFAVYKSSTKLLTSNLINEQAQARCNSKVRMNQLLTTCRKLKEEKDFQTIFSYFARRGFAESNFKTIFEISDICKLLGKKD